MVVEPRPKSEKSTTPFTIFATCETMVFDKATSSLQSDMLLNPTGGMLAGVGPTRPVYANHNKYMAYAVVFTIL